MPRPPRAPASDLDAHLVSGLHTTGPDASVEVASPAAALSVNGGGQRHTQYAAKDSGLSIAELVALDERGVAKWVANRSPKLAPFAPLFEEHQIEGALFLRLTDDMLREMGIRRECRQSLLALCGPPPGAVPDLTASSTRPLSDRATCSPAGRAFAAEGAEPARPARSEHLGG